MAVVKDTLELQVRLQEAKSWLARNEFSAPRSVVIGKRQEIEHLEEALSFSSDKMILDAEKQKVEKEYRAIVVRINSRSRASL